MKKRKGHDDAVQSKRFIDTAKHLESDESGKLFETAIASVTKNSKKQTPLSKRRKSEAANRPT